MCVYLFLLIKISPLDLASVNSWLNLVLLRWLQNDDVPTPATSPLLPVIYFSLFYSMKLLYLLISIFIMFQFFPPSDR